MQSEYITKVVDTSTKIKAVRTGNLAEALVLYRLLSWGLFPAQIAGQLPYDILVLIGQTPIRLQVKGACVKDRRCFKYHALHGGKRELYEAGVCDILAFVALPLERMVFAMPSACKSTTRIPAASFTPEEEEASWCRCLNELLKGGA